MTADIIRKLLSSNGIDYVIVEEEGDDYVYITISDSGERFFCTSFLLRNGYDIRWINNTIIGLDKGY